MPLLMRDIAELMPTGTEPVSPAENELATLASMSL
jgi:hypothetical protein